MPDTEKFMEENKNKSPVESNQNRLDMDFFFWYNFKFLRNLVKVSGNNEKR